MGCTCIYPLVCRFRKPRSENTVLTHARACKRLTRSAFAIVNSVAADEGAGCSAAMKIFAAVAAEKLATVLGDAPCTPVEVCRRVNATAKRGAQRRNRVLAAK